MLLVDEPSVCRQRVRRIVLLFVVLDPETGNGRSPGLQDLVVAVQFEGGKSPSTSEGVGSEPLCASA